MFFSENFSKFSMQLFQKTLIKSSVMGFSRVLDCTPIVLFYIKKWLHQGQFLEIFRGEIIPTKISVMDYFLVATCNICKNRLVHRHCLSGYCEIYHNFSAISLKRSTTELFLHGSCGVALFKSSRNFLRDIFAKHFLTKSRASNL